MTKSDEIYPKNLLFEISHGLDTRQITMFECVSRVSREIFPIGSLLYWIFQLVSRAFLEYIHGLEQYLGQKMPIFRWIFDVKTSHY